MSAHPTDLQEPRRVESQRVLAGVLRHVREAAAESASLLGEIELADRVGASRKQVRDALASLEQQGIVRRRQGAATEVDPVALRMSVRFEEQLEYSVLLRQLGYTTSVEVLSVELVPMPRDTAGLLMATPGSPAARIVKRWRADGAVAMLAFTTVPLPTPDLPDGIGDSVYAALREVWGETTVWEIATPSAENVLAVDAPLLEAPEGAAAMTLELIGITISGRRLFHARELHNPAVVSYSMMRSVRPPQVFSTARYQF